jgi:hypothetical protein
VQPDLPEKKLRNVRTFCEIPPSENVLAFIDHTLLGSAKNCLAVGTQGIYGRNDWTGKVSGPWHVSFQALATAQFQESGVFEIEITYLKSPLDANKKAYVAVSGGYMKLKTEMQFLQRLKAVIQKD